jgi:PAS domain S-box-containing protein
MLSASERAIAQAALAPGPHAIVSADREGVIRDWNETAEHIFGHSAGQAIGQTLDLVVPEEERADHWRNFWRVMATGLLSYRPDHVLDVEGLRRDGTRVSSMSRSLPSPMRRGALLGSQPSCARRTVIPSRERLVAGVGTNEGATPSDECPLSGGRIQPISATPSRCIRANFF